MSTSFQQMLKDSQRDLLKQLGEQQRKHVEEQLRPVKDDVAQMRAALTKIQAPPVAASGPDKVSSAVYTQLTADGLGSSREPHRVTSVGG
jgi:predicted transcriptional regulator